MSATQSVGADGPAPPAPPGGYLGTISNFFTSLQVDASGMAIRVEDQVLDAVEVGMDQMESRAKKLSSSLATFSTADARQRAVSSLTRQARDIESMFREDETKKHVAGGVAGFVHGIERALDDYDVTHAHHLARAKRVNQAAETLDAKLRTHAAAWRGLDGELASLPLATERLRAASAAVDRACDLLLETEDMLLEAEIAVKVDELYARDEETQLSRRAAKLAHREEMERLDAFRRAMAAEAQNSQVTQKSRQEIALEEELRKDLRAIRRAARKQAKSQMTEDAGSPAAFLPAPPTMDHYGLGVSDDDDDDDDDDAAAARERRGKRGTLAEAAAEIDVAGSMHASAFGDLDEFLADDAGDASGKEYYTVYGLRRQADRSRAAIEGEEPPAEETWLGSMSREAAEAVGLARKKALNLADEDLKFVNLKPPPPSGGAGADLLDDASPASRRRAPANAADAENRSASVSATVSASVTASSQYLESAAAAGSSAAAAAASSFSALGSSMLAFGAAAQRNAAASLAEAQARTRALAEAAEQRTKESAAWVNASVAAGAEKWQQHLQGAAAAAAAPAEREDASETEPTREQGPEGDDAAPTTTTTTTTTPTPTPTATAREATPEAETGATPVAEDATPEKEAPGSARRLATPAADREDRDEGFDEVMTKDESFGYWKDKDAKAAESPGGSQAPSPKPSPGKKEKRDEQA